MRGKADVVFCIDASASMRPTIRAVCDHVADFVGGLTKDSQTSWDVRFGLLAYRSDGSVFEMETLTGGNALDDLYGQGRGDSLFTNNVEAFQEAVRQVKARSDEASFIALDFALDFPWRDAADCHRVVILLTDEPLETGVCIAEQRGKVKELIDKIQALRAMLFLVGPPSDAFSELSAVDKSEYVEVDRTGDGLRSVDFSKVLLGIGKSVSVSQTGGRRGLSAKRALFHQDRWRATARTIAARD